MFRLKEELIVSSALSPWEELVRSLRASAGRSIVDPARGFISDERRASYIGASHVVLGECREDLVERLRDRPRAPGEKRSLVKTMMGLWLLEQGYGVAFDQRLPSSEDRRGEHGPDRSDSLFKALSRLLQAEGQAEEDEWGVIERRLKLARGHLRAVSRLDVVAWRREEVLGVKVVVGRDLELGPRSTVRSLNIILSTPEIGELYVAVPSRLGDTATRLLEDLSAWHGKDLHLAVVDPLRREVVDAKGLTLSLARRGFRLSELFLD